MEEAYTCSLSEEMVEIPLLWKCKSRLVALVASVLEGTCPRRGVGKSIFLDVIPILLSLVCTVLFFTVIYVLVLAGLSQLLT